MLTTRFEQRPFVLCNYLELKLQTKRLRSKGRNSPINFSASCNPTNKSLLILLALRHYLYICTGTDYSELIVCLINQNSYLKMHQYSIETHLVHFQLQKNCIQQISHFLQNLQGRFEVCIFHWL